MFQVDLGERSQDANNVENPYNISVQQLHADVQDAVIECKKTKQKAPTHSRSHRTLHFHDHMGCLQNENPPVGGALWFPDTKKRTTSNSEAVKGEYANTPPR